MAAHILYLVGQQRVAAPLAGPLTVGRSEGCELRLAGIGVSRRHCRLAPASAGFVVADLGSSRGTFLNGVRLPANEERPLRAGDRLQVGVHELTLALGDLPADVELAGALEPAAGAESEAEGTRARLAASTPTGRLEGSDDGEEPTDAGDEDAESPRGWANVDLLLATIAELHQTRDPAGALPAIVDRVIRLAGADRGLLLLRSPGEDGLETLIARTAEGEDLKRVEGTSQSVPRRVLETGEAVCITGTLPDEHEPSQSMQRHALRSLLCVPIRLRGAVRGVIYVDSQRASAEFGPRERLLLEALAAQCAIALQQAQVRREELDTRVRLEAENEALRRGGTPTIERPLALSKAMDEALRRVERVAATDLALLVTGETGAGKEVVARYAHSLGPRSVGPFVVVDCGAIPEALLESVLFGHVKGAFTGASAPREGLAQQAHRGTLLLDEVGELPLSLQPKLLRFLEERTVLPVGSDERRTVDLRVIACTHRDLEAMVAAGTFREDLFFRLNAFPVRVPPLRDRPEDLLPLARAILTRERRAVRAAELIGFTHEAQAALRAYAWPGNVRELCQRIRRASVTAEPPFVTVADLDLAAAPDHAVGVLPLRDARKEASARFEREYVTELLSRHKGRVQKAAAEAGVSRQMFQRLMSRHGIGRGEFLE